MSIHKKDIEAAHTRIQSYIRKTALERSRPLEELTQANVFLKMECQQVSGSFKARGAFNKILSIPEHTRTSQNFIAASTGNHAVAFCTALDSLGLIGKVVLPTNISPAKLEFIQMFGIPIDFHGSNSLQAEIYARKQAQEQDFTLVHPYDDPMIVAGQGTVAIELVNEIGEPDVVIVPVGGGGLISGVCAYLKQIDPSITIIGCQPERSPEMVVSVRRGSIVNEDITSPTLSDGTAGGMEPGCITFDMCKQWVDEWMLLSETEIAHAIRFMIVNHQIIVEGAGALSLAALIRMKTRLANKKVVCLITGKRISKAKLLEVLTEK
ncbi:MAG: pyridoxal-phosphate dependent enzyme [Saprospiraceae bacterium]|nr:pyridoxal-phosphate dependent enzyme [Saprospiraceae bacterium]